MKRNWKLADFDYLLPEALIAQYPLPDRAASRLLCVNKSDQSIEHRRFSDLLDFVEPNDLFVFNNTKVIPARLFGRKSTGGRVECLVERVLSANRILVHVRASKKPKLGSRIVFADGFETMVVDQKNELHELEIHSPDSAIDLFQRHGEIPLPPYIRRKPDRNDETRYQTIFAEKEGAIAAPTAGLHFDEDLFNRLTQKGVSQAFVTLHVGAGTFQPVRVESIDQHRMHHEYAEVSESVCEAVLHCKKQGGRVFAVGTTVVRCLETAARDGMVKPFHGETNLFIYPGFQFNCVDALITNFHLPKSSLLMLVSAFGGHELMMNAYEEAIEAEYRFFSYGDAMMVL